MAFYNGFPATYPQMYPQTYAPQYQAQQTVQPQQQGITWIQGKAAAMAYQVPAGQSAILLDSDAPYAYKKETGIDGRPLPMETYKLVREDEVKSVPTVQKDDLKQFVRLDEIGDIVAEKVESMVRDEVEKRLSEFSFKPTRKPRSTEE